MIVRINKINESVTYDSPEIKSVEVISEHYRLKAELDRLTRIEAETMIQIMEDT